MSDLYIGLDLSLRGAACVVQDDNGIVLFDGYWGYGLSRGSSEKERVERVVYIATKIVKTIQEATSGGQSFVIGIENYAFGARGAHPNLGELQGAIKLQLWLVFSTIADMVVASSARKKVLGKGRFSKGAKGKKEIMAAVEKQYGFKADNHDVADAFVICRYMLLKSKEMKDD